MKKPHKHAEIIHAWADGAEIEMHSPEDDRWSYISNPSWFHCIRYRVKPEESEKVL